jgi:hypothetical protein
MKRYIIFILILFFAVIMVGCSKEDEESKLEIIEVDFTVPETAQPGETVQLKALVTYGEEAVKDAEVTFEVWEQGKEEESQKYEANNHEDGTYTTEVTFEHEGIYEMYAHTDAKDMHTMPKAMITIGNPSEQEEEQGSHHEDGNHDDAHSHGEHTEGFVLHFVEPKHISAGNEVELVTHLELDGTPLENARVRYEISNDKDEQNWVETNESKAGEYVGKHIFETPGTYNLKVHVENDEGLHEHKEYEIIVH